MTEPNFYEAYQNPPNAKIGRLILFDMAGTLVDWHPDWREERLSVHTKMWRNEISQRLFWSPDSPGVEFDRGLIIATVFYQRCCELIGVEPTQSFAGVFRHAYADIFTARPQMAELVEGLSTGHELWMMSNTNVWHLDHVRLTFPYLRFVTGSCNSNETTFLKPEEGIFRTAIERSGREPGEIVFIDDREENISAAAALGIQAIHFRGDEGALVGELARLGVDIPATRVNA